MNKSEEVVRELVKSAFFGEAADFSGDIDWQEVFKEAKMQAVVALVFNCVPSDFCAEWKGYANKSKARFLRVLYEQTKVVSLLQAADIGFVIIKGYAAAIYYPTPYSRTMGDVDILVADGCFDKAFTVLQENGYKFEHDFGDDRDYRFKKDGVLFELHKKYSDKEYDIEDILQAGVSRAETVTVYGDSFPVLPQAENGLLILDHVRHHIYGGLGIRQIIDFMAFVYAEKDEEKFENEILPVFEKTGLGVLAKVIVKGCKRYFGLPTKAKWCESADDKTCDEFMDRAFASGDFGRKSPYEYRPMETFTMSVKKYGFFRTLQRSGVENSKACKKYKVLRPFAWLYQLVRLTGRGIAALFRREKLFSDVNSAKEKTDFYKRLGIL
ncbi:MAG: nucleotidyltransferase family protein [Clostridia bacterium]|nr:nucleotidyltransferase family protein [Clostridia bacterium]